MSGHNRWSQIKHQKGVADQKRALVFSKMLSAISAAARTNPNPSGNPRLRSAIETAKKEHVPAENIERALKRSAGDKPLEELTLEAYGPEGTALLIECVTDSHNRTISEVKHLLSERGAKFAEQGSVRWAFEESPEGWKPKFPQAISAGAAEQLKTLVAALEEREDVQKVVTSAFTT